MSTSSVQSSATQAPASGSFKRVLSLRDLVLFGIAFVSPTAPYALFGIVADKSNGHLPQVYLVAMVAMSFTAVSYGRMATVHPEPGSTYTFASKALHPNVGFFAGWGMILDYILIPLLSIIYVGLTGSSPTFAQSTTPSGDREPQPQYRQAFGPTPRPGHS